MHESIKKRIVAMINKKKYEKNDKINEKINNYGLSKN